jgi:ATP-binding cassette subfamily B protein
MSTDLTSKSLWRAEFRATLSLAWPLILANLSGALIHATDVVLLGRLGPETLAAGALATNLVMSISIFGMGLMIATAPMIASEIGRKRNSVRDVRRTVRQGLTDMAAMFDLIDTEAEVRDRPDAKPLVISGGALSFEDVSFAYEADRPILKGVSFAVPAGRSMAVVGPSGAGKSTLARLIYRFYDVTEGRITIDGQDLRDVTQSSLRAAIGIVPQDTVLFNDTIGYNVGYGREGASQDEIEAAARGAQIHNFIAAQPQQYETPVGERGLKLSGGEKQRVAIARTLLKDPPLLILDEATSNLDTESERHIQAALGDILRGRTSFVIAHRLSTIAAMDRLVVLEKGEIVEQGSHSELLAQGGLYARLWAHQTGGFLGEQAD